MFRDKANGHDTLVGPGRSAVPALVGAFALALASLAAPVSAEVAEAQSKRPVQLPSATKGVPGLRQAPDIPVDSLILRRAFPDHPMGPPPRQEAPQPGQAPAEEQPSPSEGPVGAQQSGHEGFCSTVDLTSTIAGVVNVAAQDNGICSNADIDTYVDAAGKTYVVQAGGGSLAWTHTEVSDPASPVIRGQFCWVNGGACDPFTYTPDVKAFHQGANDYIVMGLERLFAPFGYCGVVIVDVTDPAGPMVESQFIGSNWCDVHNVFVEKDPVTGEGLYIYATADNTNDLRVLDVSGTVDATSGVSNPVEIGRYRSPTANSGNYVHDVTVIDHGGGVGRRVYLAYWDSGLVILNAADVTPGTNPTPVVGPNVIDPNGFLNHHSFASADGSRVFIQDEFLDSEGDEPVQMWDVSNPASPVYRDGLELGVDTPVNPAHNLEINFDIDLDRLYVGWYKLGLQAWDFTASGFLRNVPAPPTSVLYHQVQTEATDDQYDGAWGVRLAVIGADTYIFTSDRGYGLIVDKIQQAAGGNNPPDAVDDPDSTNEDTAVTVNVLANDSDPDGNPLSVASVTQPANGSAVNNGDGTVTYTPNADFNGADSFTYTISDGNGGTDTATVNVTVNPVNDAPTAADDAYTTPKNTMLVVGAPGVLQNDADVDGDTLTAVLVSDASNGTLSLNADGGFTYTPDNNVTGKDTFTYKPYDGAVGDNVATVTINVKKGKGGGNGNGGGGGGDKPCNPKSPKCQP
jgi:VCBS repeat-containing protein